MAIANNSLVSPVPSVDPQYPCEKLPSLFTQFRTPSVVVVRDKVPIGFLSQKKISDVLSTRFGFALYQKRPVTELMLTDFLRVEIDSDFSDIVQQALAREQDSIYEEIVVVRNSEYVGLMSIARVLIEQSRRITVHVAELEQRGHQLEELNSQLSQALLDLRAKEEQLIQSEKMAGIGTLASGIAHDFNNMLGAILGAAELLKGKVSGNPSLLRYCEMIDNAGTRSAGLVRQLLQFSQKNIMSFRTVSLNDVIRETVFMLERSIGKETLIELALDDDLDPVKADEHQMQQVLMNLALNARDAMPTGGRIRISTESSLLDAAFCRSRKDLSPGLYVHLVVEDTGTGIASENLNKIFEPFFSTKEVGKGMGLGLAVVYGIVQRHDGHIEVESKPGGTTFRVFLPAIKTPLEIPSEVTTPSALARSHGNILLVDDETLVLQAHAEFLESIGYKVLQACDGRTAVEAFRNRHKDIDLVILDMAMPGMDGVDTLRELQAISPAVSALFVSGYSDETRFRTALSQGALGFIRKPFNHHEFSKQVKDVIAGRHNGRAQLPT